jgi:hypothetical protein
MFSNRGHIRFLHINQALDKRVESYLSQFFPDLSSQCTRFLPVYQTDTQAFSTAFVVRLTCSIPFNKIRVTAGLYPTHARS